MYNYKKDVYQMLIDKGYTQYWSKNNNNPISMVTYKRLRDKENITLKTMDTIAQLLGVKIGELWESLPDEETQALKKTSHPTPDTKKTGRKPNNQ